MLCSTNISPLKNNFLKPLLEINKVFAFRDIKATLFRSLDYVLNRKQSGFMAVPCLVFGIIMGVGFQYVFFRLITACECFRKASGVPQQHVNNPK